MTMSLSKSRFLSGLQCLKRLWWETHDGDRRPPAVDLAAENRRAWGRRVTERARALFGPGVLIDRERLGTAGAVAATREALARGAARLYEAAFEADDVHVEVDALERVPGGWRLVEVKSSTRVKDEHLPDVALQARVLRRCGLRVVRVEVAHLNPDCTFPDLQGLLVRVDVTAQVAAWRGRLPGDLEAQRTALAGDLPTVAVGAHCDQPRACPFLDRCWDALPPHHLRTLYFAREPLLADLEGRGVTTVAAIPDDVALTPAQARQRRAVRAAALVVEAGLDAALARFPGPVAFLDFETVSPSIPAWPGCAPYTHVPVQFACEVRHGDGTAAHHEHLADGPVDPRPALAERLVEALRGTRTVFAYYARFEIECLQHLARKVPALATPLLELAARMADLLPVVRDHVYHPAFGGSFGLKDVLPALLPHLAYDDLAVRDGGSASALLERMLLLDAAGDPTGPPQGAAERARLRADLLAYCRRDVVGLGALFDWLQARAPTA